jgi:hypothetical protein
MNAVVRANVYARTHGAAQIAENAAALDHRRRKPNEKRFAVRAQIIWAKERRMRTVRRKTWDSLTVTHQTAVGITLRYGQLDEYPVAIVRFRRSNALLRRVCISIIIRCDDGARPDKS